MTVVKLDWLAQFTRNEPWQKPDDPVRAPFTCSVDGETWTGATTGHVLALVREPSDRPTWDGVPRMMQTLSAKPWVSYPVNLGAVRTWLSAGIPVLVEQPGPCEECEGTGEVECGDCDGEVLHECDCGDEHDCGSCAGTGKEKCPACDPQERRKPSYPGVLYGVVVNRALFTPLNYLDGDRATLLVAGDLDPIQLVTDRWRLVVMCMRGIDRLQLPVWPA